MCFRELIFKVLQARSTTFEHKMLIIDTLKRMVAKPQLIMDIYLNFDCDPDLLDSNVFERYTFPQGGAAPDGGPTLTPQDSSHSHAARRAACAGP